jgi:tetratricopeptide (TPR) repeat protein
MFDDDDFIEGEGKSLEQLLQDYMAIKNGQSRISLDEDDFEEIIDYFIFNTKEMEGLEACEIALGYFPFSSTILQFKAEILAQLQRYGQALQVLDDLDRLDQKNVSAVLLRADIYLNQLKYKQFHYSVAIVQQSSQIKCNELLIDGQSRSSLESSANAKTH